MNCRALPKSEGEIEVVAGSKEDEYLKQLFHSGGRIEPGVLADFGYPGAAIIVRSGGFSRGAQVYARYSIVSAE